MKRGRGQPKKARHVADYKQLGDPPTDPLEAITWAGKALVVAMHKIAIDPDLREKDRRAELRATAKVMAALVPSERTYAAEQTVRLAADRMSERISDPKTNVASQSKKSFRIDPK
jgi:hypothetical protein